MLNMSLKIAIVSLVVLVAVIMGIDASPAMSPDVKSLMKRAYPDAKPLAIIKRSPHANGKPF
ncbi:hypothetical protein MJO28_001602 [Puccinia striiformis f. sp. tritici]|uniref:Uncharacterized protein n=3 Tax=Puccinia striiformis TaxID=27350 RepID=A0A0L0W538_9BASI|nr:hypothetical protein Pst134EB_004210 [Puccinia striiformis f. sp. tritici]KAI9626150.1 hypothetical protein H4Q26_015899 [Puccinia striiformis f. sp. tritici PST-130]KNF06572.1 hypothetical protein PSTG_00445 [Puccinia striiformis f. sp. tritici PST-78]POW19300.1 hypothetical protein PSHT_04859 [Puccinia striiformis]KAI7961113.1 hypothetical protein MJO28_001602 [Puccinia striiformis f. sp. tritici]